MVQPITVGDWLREKCQRDGLSLRQAGVKTGLSHATIRDIISGNRPSPETVTKLARFGGDGENERAVLEDELLVLAGWRVKRELKISQPLAELVDIASDFSEPQLRLLNAFAKYLVEVSLEPKKSVVANQ